MRRCCFVQLLCCSRAQLLSSSPISAFAERLRRPAAALAAKKAAAIATAEAAAEVAEPPPSPGQDWVPGAEELDDDASPLPLVQQPVQHCSNAASSDAAAAYVAVELDPLMAAAAVPAAHGWGAPPTALHCAAPTTNYFNAAAAAAAATAAHAAAAAGAAAPAFPQPLQPVGHHIMVSR